MSIAEKLTAIAENQQRVYDAGYAAGQAEGGGIDVGYVELLRKVDNVELTSLNHLGEVFGKDVVVNLDSATDLSWFCAVMKQENINTTVEHLTINCPNQVSQMREMVYCFWNCADTTLKRVTLNVDTQKATSWWGAFQYQQRLEVIDGNPIDATGASNFDMFNNATAIREVRFVAGTIKVAFAFSSCPNFSAETVQSIVDGLADLTGQATKTVTLHKNIVLTDAQKSVISAKNWTLVQ